MTRRVSYDISEDTYLKAIAWIDNGGTKKGACEILGVSNNKTMERLIDEFHSKKRIDKEQRAKKRKTAVTKEEIVGIITSYLTGSSLQELADTYFRSVNVIKHHLEKNGAMLRETSKIDPLNPPLLPDACVSDTFEVNQYVWVAKYGCIGQVKAPYKNAWRVRVWKDGIMEYTYQPAYELGNLSHIEELGVDLARLTQESLTSDEITMAINDSVRAANKRSK